MNGFSTAVLITGLANMWDESIAFLGVMKNVSFKLILKVCSVIICDAFLKLRANWAICTIQQDFL